MPQLMRLHRRKIAVPCFVEFLESRQLLAADVAGSAGAEVLAADGAATAELDAGTVEGTDVASFYAGRIKFPASDELRRQRRDVVINVTSAQENGAFQGTISAAGLGEVSFSGQMTGGRKFSADITGEVLGNLYGEIRNRGGRLVASVVRDDQTQLGIQARAVTARGQTVVLPADGVVGGELAAGTVAFTGLAQGRGAFRQRVDDPARSNEDFTPGRRRNDVALEITDQTSGGLLGGHLRVGDRTVPVNGIANDDRLTLLVLPEPGTVADANVSTGVLRLNLDPLGARFAGRYSNAADGVLDVGRLSLTRPEPVGALPTASFGSIGGLAGAIEAGSFRGDPLSTAATGLGAPTSTDGGLGTGIDIGSTRVNPIASSTPTSATGIGVAGLAGAGSTAPTFTAGAPTSAGLLLDRTYSGGLNAGLRG